MPFCRADLNDQMGLQRVFAVLVVYRGDLPRRTRAPRTATRQQPGVDWERMTNSPGPSSSTSAYTVFCTSWLSEEAPGLVRDRQGERGRLRRRLRRIPTSSPPPRDGRHDDVAAFLSATSRPTYVRVVLLGLGVSSRASWSTSSSRAVPGGAHVPLQGQRPRHGPALARLLGRLRELRLWDARRLQRAFGRRAARARRPLRVLAMQKPPPDETCPRPPGLVRRRPRGRRRRLQGPRTIEYDGPATWAAGARHPWTTLAFVAILVATVAEIVALK